MKQLLLITTFLALMAGEVFAQPAVNGSTPSRNAINVALDANINIGFNQTMDASTLNANSILVYGTYRGKYSGAISYSGTTAVFNPDDDFLPGEVITVVVTTGAESSGNVAISKSFSFSFTTEADGDGLFKPEVSFSAVPSSQADDVVAVDLNGNGLVDLAALSQGSNSISVHFNNGDETFASPEVLSTANIPMKLIAADVNGDGIQDLIAANYSANSMSVFINNGDDTFATRADYGTPSSLAASDLVAIDLTGNGHLDIVQLHINNPNPGQYLFLFPNNGDGTFGTATQYGITDLNGGGTLAVGDYNRDWRADIVLADYDANSIRLYENDGSGTQFLTGGSFPVGTNPTALALVNLDGNGYVDAVTTNSDTDNITIRRESSNFAFFNQQTFSTGSYPYAISGGDLDGDGDLDLVVANNSGGNISFMRNQFSDSFPSSFFPNIEYNISGNPNQVILADLNGNGKLDIVSANTNGTLSILYNYPGPEIASVTPANNATDVDAYSDIQIVFSVDYMDATTMNASNIILLDADEEVISATFDFSGTTLTITPDTPFQQGTSVSVNITDGVKSTDDLAIINPSTISFAVAESVLEITSVSPSAYSFQHPVNNGISINFSENVVLSTLDDGVSVTGSIRGSYAGTWSGTSTATFTPSSNFLPGEVITVKIKTSVTSVSGAPVELPYEFEFMADSNPLGSFLASQEFGTAIGIEDMFIADMTNNGNPDVVIYGYDYMASDFYIKVMTSDGLGSLVSTLSTSFTPFRLKNMLLSDFDNDGNIDVAILDSHVDAGGGEGGGEEMGEITGVTGGSGETSVTIIFGNGDGTFNTTPVKTSLPADYVIETFVSGDLNGNGNTDLVFAREEGNDIIVALGAGDGTFSVQSPISSTGGPYAISLADVNGDGMLDLITGNVSSSQIAVRNGNGDGTFGSSSAYSVSFEPWDIIVSDFNNDGYPDLAVLDEDSQTEVLLNNGAGGFSSAQTFATGWKGQTIDFDGDSYLDLVFNTSSSTAVYTNNGDGTFNTSPKVFSSDSPSGFQVLDMTGNGSADIITRTGSSIFIEESAEPVFVTSFTPTANALDVVTTTPITVTFNLDMDAATLNASSIKVSSSQRGKIAGTYSYDAGSRTATFTPTDNYSPGETISVNVTKDAESSGGVPIEAAKFFSFTAEADGFGFFEQEDGFTLTSAVQKIESADMTGNGSSDLIVASYGDLKVFEKDGTGEFVEISSLTISSLSSFWVHDINQDGSPDIIIQRSSDNYIYFFINNGTGGFVETDYTLVDNAYLNANVSTFDLAFVDLNGNGLEDIVYTSSSFSNARIQIRTGDFTFGSTTFLGSSGGYALEVADANQDGIPDIVWATGSSSDGQVNIALGQGGGSYGSVITKEVGARPENLAVADFTGDGHLDIASSDKNGQSYSVIINNGNSTFANATIYNMSGYELNKVIASDIDGDGDLDLVFEANDDNEGVDQTLVAYNDGNGGLGNQLFYSYKVDNEGELYTVGPKNITLLDIEGNGRLDIAGYVRTFDESFNNVYSIHFLKNVSAGAGIAPTVAASNPATSGIGFSSATLSWTNGDGLRRLVVVKEGSAVDATMTDDAGYSANPTFGSGTEIGTGNFVVYGGSSNSVTIGGLEGETDYHFAVYEINGIPGQEKVLTTTPATGSFTTAAPPEIWTIADESITFTKANFADWTLEANQDRIAYNVWITREGSDGLFNIYSQSEYGDGDGKIKWAYGTADNLDNLTFKDFKGAVGDWDGLSYVNDDGPVDLVLYLVESNTYVEVRLEQWTSGSSNGGGFSYTRAAGTVPPPPPPTFDSEPGYALSFDGTDDYIYYDLVDPDTEDAEPMPDPVTFEMWVKPGTFTDDKMVIGSSYGTQYRFGIDSTRAFYATFREGGGGPWKRATGTTIANANQWYHLAISVKSDGEVKVYVNGVLEGSTSITEVTTGIDRYHFGGMRFPDNEEYHRFNGLMDEVRIWKAERTEAEIRAGMFNTNSGGDYSNMFATWQMNEGTGASVVDLVNGNDMDLDQDGASHQPAWVTSDVPLGSGTSSSTSSFTTGTVSVGNTSLNMADGFDNPVDIQVTEVTSEPNTFPSGFTAGVGGKYFIIDLFGDPGTFEASLTLTYGEGVITAQQESNPGLLKLYKRPSSADASTEWTEVGGASTADASTGVVTWNGITSFSQFIAVGDEISLDIQVADGVDVVSYDEALYTFGTGFFDLAYGYEDSTLTVSASSTLNGTLYLDQNDNSTYDVGIDSLLTENSEEPYTPSGSIKLRYLPADYGYESTTITLKHGAEADAVSLDFFTVEGDAELLGNTGENGWYLLANPMDSTVGMLLSKVWTQGAINSDAPTGDATLYTFSQDSSVYVPITTDLDTTRLSAGQGLLAYLFEDDDLGDGEDDIDGGWPKTLTNYGNPFGTDVSIPVKNVDHDGVSGTTGSEGFVLMGNPYGWPLSADSVIATIKKEDPLANSYVYRWKPVEKVYELSSTGAINPYESFFVRVVTSGTNASLSFDYEDAAIEQPAKQGNEKSFEFTLIHSESELESSSFLRFEESGNTAIDPFDGYYLGTYASRFANLYTLIGDQPLTINNLPSGWEGELEYPIYMHATETGDFNIKWDKEGLPEGVHGTLTHVATGEEFSLNAQDSYSFKMGASQSVGNMEGLLYQHTLQKVKTRQAIKPVFMLTISSSLGTSNENDLGIPDKVELHQNYPNPFNPTSTIRYGVPEAAKVRLEVFDILGRNVMTLVNNETKNAGRYNVQFDARSLASGLYIYRLVVGDKVLTKKMTLIK